MKSGTHIISHNSFENLRERFEFFIQGRKGKSLTNLKQYQQYLAKLYKNENVKLPYYKAKNIGNIGCENGNAKVDNSAQKLLEDINKGEQK